MRIGIINGPNLNLLGLRQPEIYGQLNFDVHLERMKVAFPQVELLFFQSNHEGQLIDVIQQYGLGTDGIILNAGAYTHTSIAIADAVAAVPCDVVEVHISNIYARESYRHISKIALYAKGSISGFGLEGYTLALVHLISRA